MEGIQVCLCVLILCSVCVNCVVCVCVCEHSAYFHQQV